MNTEYRSVTFTRAEWLIIELALMAEGVTRRNKSRTKYEFETGKSMIALADELQTIRENFDSNPWEN